YDARSRAMLRFVADELQVPWEDVLQLENTIAQQLRLSDGTDAHIAEPNAETVTKRNQRDGKNRWLFMGLATVAGGAMIGLTAGLAAPFIGAGIGAALTTLGVSAGTGVGAFMGSAGGLALITTGGVITGGSMSGLKMAKRTKGIGEFTFLALHDALRLMA
ncbi:hypothetical protein CXG81DRAFT_1022, partial [Caulochytrium protostelioides]